MVRKMRRYYEVADDAFDERGILKDGRSVRVPLMLTDAEPVRSPIYLSDGSPAPAPLLHRPSQVRHTDAQIDVRERALAERSRRLKDAWRGTPMAPDDDDVFDLATKLAPLLHLPQPIRTRGPMDAADPDANVDPGTVDPRQAALDQRARWKKDAWKTRVRR
jgi:hypothetical protein